MSNGTGHTIEYLYYRACGESTYDATKLGSVPIRPGMTYFAVDDGLRRLVRLGEATELALRLRDVHQRSGTFAELV